MVWVWHVLGFGWVLGIRLLDGLGMACPGIWLGPWSLRRCGCSRRSCLHRRKLGPHRWPCWHWCRSCLLVLGLGLGSISIRQVRGALARVEHRYQRSSRGYLC